MREFGTRTSFRPRPLDINRQLPIVRDLSELDSTEGLVSREITHNHEALDKENEEVRNLLTWQMIVLYYMKRQKYS